MRVPFHDEKKQTIFPAVGSSLVCKIIVKMGQIMYFEHAYGI